MNNEKIIVNNKADYFSVKYSLFNEWSKYLEFKQRGTTLYYLQLETKDSLSQKILCERCNITPSIAEKIEALLIKLKFIDIKKGRDAINELYWKEYTILVLPEFPERLAKAHLRKEVISIDGKTFDEIIVKKPKEQIEKLLHKKTEESWGCNDVLEFYKQSYKIVFGDYSKGKFTMADRANMKQMLEEYGGKKVKKTIEYALKNWKDLEYVGGYPSIRAIFGFRETLVPEATLGKLKKGGGRQYSGHTKDKGVNEW